MSAIDNLTLKLAAASISTEQREKWRRQGVSMPDGSYPIPNVDFLKRAIQSFGRAPDSAKAAVKAHIKSRARALGRTDLIPADWA